MVRQEGGRDLSALVARLDRGDLRQVEISQIDLNDYQPRQVFSQEALEDLARSLEENGLIQPIILRKKPGGYQLVAGERRLRAASYLGWTRIASIVRDLDQEEAARLALIENIQREDLNPLEEALAYRTLMEEFSLTQEELGASLGKSRSHIANSVRLLGLPEDMKEGLAQGSLSPGQGKLLLGLKDPDLRRQAYEEIQAKKLTVRQSQDLIRSLEPRKKPRETRDPYLRELEENLMLALGNKVRLVPGKKKGLIEIEYYGEEDLARLIDILS